MTVLVCEDEEVMLTSLEFRLKKQGFNVEVASDGKQAVEKIKANAPDLVVADIMMPHITGIELIQFVRQEMKSSLPIIIISALEHDDTILEAFKQGATDFISKPFKPSELVVRIKKIFQEMS